ncbi:MAG: four helix bundle protein [Chitinophagaceae bacterium]|nr:four helix bundle protein [Chitinophagaceae bacterium]
MFLLLKHTKLDVYQAARSLAICCYRLTLQFPDGEKFGMVSQIRRASVSVFLNISEGASRASEKDRERFFEIARSSVAELDAAFTLAIELGFLKIGDTEELGGLLNRTFQMLSKMIRRRENRQA